MQPQFLLLAILCGLTFGYIMFHLPLLLVFHTGLNNCEKHGTESGCLASPSNVCFWLSEQNKCVFAVDYLTVNCSAASNSSSTCLGMSSTCEYLYNKKLCVHRAGFTAAERGGVAAAAISGGIFGPVVMQKLWRYYFSSSVAALMLAISCCSLLAATLFTAGIETGEIGLWCVGKVFGSVCSFTGMALLPGLLEHERVAISDRQLLIKLAGALIGCAAFLVAVYLFVDTPRTSEKAGLYNQDPVFKTRLHSFNALQYFVTAGFAAFAIYFYCRKQDQPEAASSPPDQQQHEEQQQDGQAEQPNEAPLRIEAATAESSSEQVEDEARKPEPETPQQQPEQPKTPEVEEDDTCLMWAQTVFLPLQQQLCGLGAVASYLPVILEDTISDPLLAQLVFAASLPFGAVTSFFLFAGYLELKPLTIHIFAALVCAAASMMIGFSLVPSDDVEGGSTRQGLALSGVIIFGIFFGAGPSAMYFAALAQIFFSKTDPTRVATGVAVGGGLTATIQLTVRLLFPVFVENVSSDVRVGRSAAFFGFCVLSSVSGLILTILTWLRNRSKAD